MPIGTVEPIVDPIPEDPIIKYTPVTPSEIIINNGKYTLVDSNQINTQEGGTEN